MTKANLFLASSWVGLAGVLATMLATISVDFASLGLPGGLTAVFAGWVMLITRNADEYTRALWTAAASLAFATLLVLYLALPYGEGFIDGLTEALTDVKETKRDIPASASVYIAIAAFYAGLFGKRLLGDTV